MHGARPTPLDKRDFSHHRTFGSATPTKWPAELILDHSGIFPDQDKDGLPNGCTGYTQADNASNRDGVQYKPKYTYERTCLMEGHDDTQGCDIRNSMKSTHVYGTQTITEDTDQEAERHRGGAYFNIYDDGALDFFDSARHALMLQKVPLSAGSPWFPEWLVSGALLSGFYYDGNPNHYPWHNWAIKGWRDINGEPALMVKSWQGIVGDNGWQYIGRDTFNNAMEIRGSALFYQLGATPADVNTIKLDLWSTMVLFLHRILSILVTVKPPLN